MPLNLRGPLADPFPLSYNCRYSWHFPELLKIVADNYMYASLVTLIKRRDTLSTESLPGIERVVMDADKAQVWSSSKNTLLSDGNSSSPLPALFFVASNRREPA